MRLNLLNTVKRTFGFHAERNPVAQSIRTLALPFFPGIERLSGLVMPPTAPKNQRDRVVVAGKGCVRDYAITARHAAHGQLPSWGNDHANRVGWITG